MSVYSKKTIWFNKTKSITKIDQQTNHKRTRTQISSGS